MKANVLVCALSSAGLVASLAGTAAAAPWIANNLVVLELGPTQNVGVGAPNLNAVGHAVTLKEYNPTANFFTGNNLGINSNKMLGTALVMAGNATSEGHMNLSENGNYLVFGGYDANQGQSGNATAGSSIALSTNNGGAFDANRVVAAVTNTQATSLHRITDSYSTRNFRSAASTTGTSFVGAGSGDGLREVMPPGTTTTVVANNVANLRVARYDLGGRLFVSSASGTTQGVAEVLAGVITPLPGFPTTSGPSAYDFEFTDANTLYVADDRTTAAGGLQKWTLASGTWTLQYTIAVTNGLRSIAITQNGLGQNVIYGISGGTSAGGVTNLISITDTGAGSMPTILQTSGAGTVFRSVEFVPTAIPTPGACALLGLGGLIAARRRRA